MKISKIVCDHCGKDLTYTTHQMEYRILLTGVRMTAEEEETLNSEIRHDPIGEPKDFCSVECLRFWAIDENARTRGIAK